MPAANVFRTKSSGAVYHPRITRGISNESRNSASSFGSTITVQRRHKWLERLERPLSLKELISERQWDRAAHVIRVKSKYARKSFVVPCFLNEWKGQAEIYPLHQALSSPTVPFDFVEALIFAYPEALLKRETGMKRNCLHIALRAGVSYEIVLYLIEKYPSLVCANDTQGRIPLHYAVSNFASVEVVRKLISVHPRSIVAPDNRGWTSLHVAVSKCTDPVIVRLLVSVCPEAVAAKTFAGSYASKIVELCPSNNSSTFREILREEENKYFSSPIHKNIRQRSIKTTEINESFV